MTTRQFQTIFFIILGLCILTMVHSFTSFDFVEVDPAINWTMKYFALPILIIMIPSCCFIYIRFIRQHETKEYKSKIWTQLRTIFKIFILTLGTTGIFIGTMLSMIILTNSYIGDSKTINLNAKLLTFIRQKIKDEQIIILKFKTNNLTR